MKTITEMPEQYRHVRVPCRPSQQAKQRDAPDEVLHMAARERLSEVLIELERIQTIPHDPVG